MRLNNLQALIRPCLLVVLSISRLWLAWLFLFFFSTPAAFADTSLVATQLNDKNFHLAIKGPDAIAGKGDWLISNGTVCAVISDRDHETGLSAWGGSLIDVGHCQKNNDQWAFNHLMPNMDKELILRPVAITAKADASEAVIKVVARSYGLESISQYRLDLLKPEQLTIEHELRCLSECPAISMLGMLTLHPHRVLTPYTLSTLSSEYMAGFHHSGFDRFDTSSQLAAMLPNDISILVGAGMLGADVSYGVQVFDAYLLKPGEEKQQLPIFSITHPDYTLQAVLSGQPWIGGEGKLGAVEMLQSLLMRLAVGETLLLSQRLLLAEATNVAAVTDQFYQGRELTGVVVNPPARINITAVDGKPVTFVAMDEAGPFSVIIPRAVKRVNVEVVSPWGREPAFLVAMNKESVAVGNVGMKPGSFLKVSADAPLRVSVIGVDVEDPLFYDDLSGFSIDGKLFSSAQTVNYISLAGDKLSSGFLPVKPGRYQLLASRGLEHGVSVREVNIEAGTRVALELEAPAREVSTTGYLAADFHVHSGLSFDSALPVAERLRSFAAQGGEVLIATEHNRLVDLSPVLQDRQLDEMMVVMPGIELTGMVRSDSVPFTHGHQNIFPLAEKPGQFSGGLPRHEGRRLRSLINDVRQQSGRVLFQLNHPRDFDAPDPDLAYFENLLSGDAYNASQVLSAEPNRSLVALDPVSGVRDIDVDLLEVANGNNFAMYEAVRADWFSLLSQGERIFGSANSDSHGSSSLVAMPVNYVAVADDSIAAYRQDEFIGAVTTGNFFGTTGPLLSLDYLSAEGDLAYPGGELSGREVSMRLTVTAASWVPVDQLKLYINGKLDRSLPINVNERVEIALSFNRDSYVVVEVDAAPSEIYQKVAPGFKPFAFSNPVFIDADNDGHWQPPGLQDSP